MLELLHDDVLAFEHFESDHVEDQGGGLAHKTTVGLMERDCVVTNVLIGSPAEELMQVLLCDSTCLRDSKIHLRTYKHSRECLCVQRDDQIVSVDGQTANKHNVIELLIGEDTPGSFVRVGYVRNGAPEETCLLQRMSVSKIANRRRMFELFTGNWPSIAVDFWI